MPRAGPASIPVGVGRLEELFAEAAAGFPYRGRPLRETAAERLVAEARSRRSASGLRIDIEADPPALSAGEEARFRADWAGFYAVEGERARLALAINRTEGWRAFLLGIAGSLLAVAVLVPLRLWIGPDFFFLEFVLVVVVWILMWDSLELLLFDTMFLRMRCTAIEKLRAAEIRFRYRSAPGSGTGQI